MSDAKHIREDIPTLKADYDAMRNLYLDRCEQCGVDMLPCLECDHPDSSAAITEIIRRTHNTGLLPDCCCRRREYYAKKKAKRTAKAATVLADEQALRRLDEWQQFREGDDFIPF
jgi:hypothetical protein